MRVGNGGIAHQGIKPAELAQHLGHTDGDLGLIGDIHGNEPGIVTQHFGGHGATRTVKVGQHHLPAFTDQPGSNAKANPPCRTGDQCDTTVMAAFGG